MQKEYISVDCIFDSDCEVYEDIFNVEINRSSDDNLGCIFLALN